MATQTAIVYGTDRVRLLEFDGSGKKLRVLQVVDVPLESPEGDDQELTAEDLAAEAIAEAADEHDVTADPSGMSFDAGHALFREFTLPFTADEQIEKVVRFEAESHIPLDIDDVVMQHLVLRKTRDKSHILAAAIKKDDLLDRFDVLEEADMDPMFVDMDVFSLLNALHHTGVTDEHERCVVLDVADHATNLLFLVDGTLFAVRSLRMGAHGIPRGEGAQQDEITTARAHDFLGRLKREVRRTLTTLPGLGSLEAVLATGSGSQVPGFDEAVSEAFGAPVEPLDLLARVDHKLDGAEAAKVGPDIGAALGVAFKLNGLDVTGADFRRDECAYTKKFDQVKSPLIVLSFVIFLVAALMAIDAFYQVRKVRSEYEIMLGNAKEQLKLEVGDEGEARAVWSGQPFGPRQMQAIVGRFRANHDSLAADLGRSEQIPAQYSAFSVWIELSELLAANEDLIGRLWLNKIDIVTTPNDQSVRLTGLVNSAESYNELYDVLRNDSLFSNVQAGDTSLAKDGERTAFSDTILEIDVEELERRRQRNEESRA